MSLKTVLESLDEVQSQFHELYEEKDGKYVLTIEGIDDHPDVVNLKTAFEKQKADNGKLRKRNDDLSKTVEGFGEMTPEQLQEIQDELEDLRSKSESGELPTGEELEQKVQERLQSRLEREIRPFKRDIEKITQERDEISKTLQAKQEQIKAFTIDTAVEQAADKLGVHKSAKRDIRRAARDVFDLDEDGSMLAKDEMGNPDPDLTPEKWLEAQRDDAPHWFPQSHGGGASGNDKSVPSGVRKISNIETADDLEAIARGEAVRAH